MSDDAERPTSNAERDGREAEDGAPRADDPRLGGEYVRRIPSGPDGGEVLLVGVVHDHPSSQYRVRSLVESERPDVLALELPPTAVPLFVQYADDERTPPARGGEMSAAVQAAATDRVVGIDGPSLGFLRHLAGSIRSEGPTRSTIRGAVRRLVSTTRHALVCRFAGVLQARTRLHVEVDRPTVHDCGADDPPERQATDERRQVRRATSVMNALERAPASRCCDEARNAHMAARLSRLREDGDVLAVVGVGHLDEVGRQLRER